MLQQLRIENFALIRTLQVDLAPGLNVLTGETGAGKSILIDALGLALGDRANAADIVRAGEARAQVEAVFDTEGVPAALSEKLTELGVSGEDAELIIGREVALASGKSQCRVGGRLMPVSALRDVGDYLVDVHGQHDHQLLLHADRHLDILDTWAGPDVLSRRTQMAERYRALAALEAERERLRADARERARMLDLYRFQKNEIADADLRPGEEEELIAERTRLGHAEKLRTVAEEARATLSGVGDSVGAADSLAATVIAIEHVIALDPTLEEILEPLREASAFAEDASRRLSRYHEELDADPTRLDTIETRLETLRVLRRKYGETVDAVIAYGKEATAALDRLENAEAHEAEITRAVQSARSAADTLAAELTALRADAAREFASRVVAELADLAMATTRFEVSIVPGPLGAAGADRVEFLLSANPGEPLRPLARVASGGEMSRIMLAMKSVMSRSGQVPTMVFDEIDAGVGGRTANVLGEKLKMLAADAQVLCITHLPQIAARADAHFLIEKRVDGNRTTVDIRRLTGEERVEEIVRMLGGQRQTDAARQHARELLALS